MLRSAEKETKSVCKSSERSVFLLQNVTAVKLNLETFFSVVFLIHGAHNALNNYKKDYLDLTTQKLIHLK